eukprot:6176594-Pleurochrysis_carterae.AAC.2
MPGGMEQSTACCPMCSHALFLHTGAVMPLTDQTWNCASISRSTVIVVVADVGSVDLPLCAVISYCTRTCDESHNFAHATLYSQRG